MNMTTIAQHVRRFAWAGLIGLAAGCGASASSATPTNMQELNNTVLSSYSTSHPDRLYYTGSEGDFDFYYLENQKKEYKVPKSQSLQEPRMKRTQDRSQWQVVTPMGAADTSGS